MPATTYSDPTRTAARRTRSAILSGVVLVGAVLAGVLGYQSLAASSSSAASPVDTLHGDHQGAPGGVDTLPHSPRGEGAPDRETRSGVAVADGAVPSGVTVFDVKYPAVANLDPALLRALGQAATNAASEGVESYVNSGWRSPKYQERLLRQAISKYGSEREAARWVSTAQRSAHVSGDAVDIGPSDAAAWLSEHGAEYGLCQIYSNEPWHYEVRPEAVDHGCPARYADPTHDPRMQQ
jgi:D-alanyl-D-alanine carboxypeptidase